MDKDEAVIETAQEEARGTQEKQIHTLSTGVRVRVSPVAAGLITKAQMKIKYPKVPTFYNADKDREEENPNHPDYLADYARVNEERGMATLDVMCMFGLELVDGIPDTDWVRRLKLVMPDLDFDENDSLLCEYYYKTLIAVGVQDSVILAKAMGVSEEAIAQAEESFPGNPQRGNNRRASVTQGRKRGDKVRS